MVAIIANLLQSEQNITTYPRPTRKPSSKALSMLVCGSLSSSKGEAHAAAP